jgi:hypothetical protein
VRPRNRLGMTVSRNTNARSLSGPIRLMVGALFQENAASLESDSRTVSPVHVTVRYHDGRPVTGLGSENFSIVNAEDSFDLARLFCVTAFVTPPQAGVYEIAMHSATWSGYETTNHCCLVRITRVPRLSHAIELGRARCCMS